MDIIIRIFFNDAHKSKVPFSLYCFIFWNGGFANKNLQSENYLICKFNTTLFLNFPSKANSFHLFFKKKLFRFLCIHCHYYCRVFFLLHPEKVIFNPEFLCNFNFAIKPSGLLGCKIAHAFGRKSTKSTPGRNLLRKPQITL